MQLQKSINAQPAFQEKPSGPANSERSMQSTATSSEVEEEKFAPRVQLESINHEAVDSELIIKMDGQEGEAAAPEGDSDRLTEMGDDDQR